MPVLSIPKCVNHGFKSFFDSRIGLNWWMPDRSISDSIWIQSLNFGVLSWIQWIQIQKEKIRKMKQIRRNSNVRILLGVLEYSPRRIRTPLFPSQICRCYDQKRCKVVTVCAPNSFVCLQWLWAANRAAYSIENGFELVSELEQEDPIRDSCAPGRSVEVAKCDYPPLGWPVKRKAFSSFWLPRRRRRRRWVNRSRILGVLAVQLRRTMLGDVRCWIVISDSGLFDWFVGSFWRKFETNLWPIDGNLVSIWCQCDVDLMQIKCQSSANWMPA